MAIDTGHEAPPPRNSSITSSSSSSSLPRRDFLRAAGVGLGAILAGSKLGNYPLSRLGASARVRSAAASSPIVLKLGQHQAIRQKIDLALLPLFESQMTSQGQNIRVALLETTLPDKVASNPWCK